MIMTAMQIPQSKRSNTDCVTEVLNGTKEDHLHQKFQIQGYQNKDGLSACRKLSTAVT